MCHYSTPQHNNCDNIGFVVCAFRINDKLFHRRLKSKSTLNNRNEHIKSLPFILMVYSMHQDSDLNLKVWKFERAKILTVVLWLNTDIPPIFNIIRAFDKFAKRFQVP